MGERNSDGRFATIKTVQVRDLPVSAVDTRSNCLPPVPSSYDECNVSSILFR